MAPILASRFRFSTADMPEADRLPAWRDAVVRPYLHADVVVHSGGDRHFAVDLVPLGEVTAGSFFCTPSRLDLVPGKANASAIFLVGRRGELRLMQADCRIALANGDAVSFDALLGGAIHCASTAEFWWASVPEAAVNRARRGLKHALPAHIPAANPSLRLFTAYLAALFALDEIVEPTLAGLHLADLALSAIGGGAPERKDDSGIRAARLRAILALIDEGAGEPDLDPAKVARRLGVSVRYVHKLLADSGSTFSAHLLARRMQRVQRLLSDPGLAWRKISEIALEAGFSDLSHFNRSFRRRFGMTPSELRARAGREQR